MPEHVKLWHPSMQHDSSTPLIPSFGDVVGPEVGAWSNRIQPIAPKAAPCWFVEAVRGRRPRMEDAYCHGSINICHEAAQFDLARQQQVLFGGCFDGHGGDLVAKYAAKNMANRLCRRLAAGKAGGTQVAAALSAALTDLDRELYVSKLARMKGSTAVVALVTRSTVYISSCGDSRAVIINGGKAFQPIQDHTPIREDEQDRIRKAGGHILQHNGCRVMGALAMTRAIGDHALRPYGVISDPDVAEYTRHPDDDFLLLASDGLWNAFTNQDAANFISAAVTALSSTGLTRQQIATVLPKLLTKAALARGSSDNITVVLLDLQQQQQDRCSAGSSNDSAEAVDPAGAVVAAVPAQIYVGSRCSITDDDVSVTAAAVECMRALIRQATAAAVVEPIKTLDAADLGVSSSSRQQGVAADDNKDSRSAGAVGAATPDRTLDNKISSSRQQAIAVSDSISPLVAFEQQQRRLQSICKAVTDMPYLTSCFETAQFNSIEVANCKATQAEAHASTFTAAAAADCSRPCSPATPAVAAAEAYVAATQGSLNSSNMLQNDAGSVDSSQPHLQLQQQQQQQRCAAVQRYKDLQGVLRQQTAAVTFNVAHIDRCPAATAAGLSPFLNLNIQQTLTHSVVLPEVPYIQQYNAYDVDGSSISSSSLHTITTASSGSNDNSSSQCCNHIDASCGLENVLCSTIGATNMRKRRMVTTEAPGQGFEAGRDLGWGLAAAVQTRNKLQKVSSS